jgi:glycosyltransferase involved in cell wall biosynthesis
MLKPVRRVGVDACPLGPHRTGVGNYVHALLEPLVRRHPDVHFYLYSNDEVVFPDLPNVTLRVSRPKRRGPLWQNTQLSRMLREDRPQVHWGTNGMLPLWGPAGLVKVLTVHDLADRFAPATQQRLVRWNRLVFQNLSARRAHHALAVSAATARDMERFYGCQVEGVIRPLAAPPYRRPDPETVARVRDRHGLAGPYWLSVGTLEPRKNLSALMRAYLACRDRGLDLPPLVLAGGAGWLNSEIEALAARAEALGAVRRLGFVPGADLPALYAGCDVFLMPSLYEGFGMPILEAQMCGAPVVHGEHGSMVEAGGELGVPVAPDQASLEALVARLARGEVPLACRLPGDPEVQGEAEAVARLERALGLVARAARG